MRAHGTCDAEAANDSGDGNGNEWSRPAKCNCTARWPTVADVSTAIGPSKHLASRNSVPSTLIYEIPATTSPWNRRQHPFASHKKFELTGKISEPYTPNESSSTFMDKPILPAMTSTLITRTCTFWPTSNSSSIFSTEPSLICVMCTIPSALAVLLGACTVT